MKAVSILAILISSLFFLGLAGLHASNQSLIIPIHNMDGSYQTASGLIRIAHGQMPGQDFFPYLGLGLLFFLYPIFQYEGGNMAATVFASNFACSLALAFSIGTVAGLMVRHNRFFIGFLVGATAGSAILLAYPNISEFLASRLTPGNSLRPLRAFIPYLAASIACGISRTEHLSPLQKCLLVAAVSGFSALWSTDYGLPTAGLIGVYALGLAYSQRILTFKNGALIVATGVTVCVSLFMALTGGYVLPMLKYILFDVANDQYWFFPSWYKASRALSFSDLYYLWLRPAVGAWVLVLPLVAAIAWISRSHAVILSLIVGLSTLLGGALASYGGHIEYGYAEAFLFWCQASLIFLPLRLVGKSTLSHMGRVPKDFFLAIPCIIVPALLVTYLYQFADYYRTGYRASQAPDHYKDAELGGYVPTAWRENIALAKSSESTFAEDYFGFWGVLSDQRGMYPADSVIHALGAVREDFKERLHDNHPDVILTTNRSLASSFLGWNLSVNWWFYGYALEHYTPKTISPVSYLWTSSNNPVWPATECQIVNNDNGPSFQLSATEIGFYEVTLHYDASKLSARTLLFAQNNINFAVYADGFVPLDPTKTMATFPVAVTKSDRNRFGFRLITDSDKLYPELATGCSARRVILAHNEMMPPLTPSLETVVLDLTEGPWTRGILNSGAGFVVANNEAARKAFAPAQAVRFADGTTRSILTTEESGELLKVFMLGEEPLPQAAQAAPLEVWAAWGF